MKKKILFVLPRMGGGGAERVVALLANALSARGDDVTIHTLVGGESFYPLHPDIHQTNDSVYVDRRNKLTTIKSELTSLPKSFLSIRRMIKEQKYDVVFSLLVETDILVGACKLTGIRFHHVCSERNDPFIHSTLERFVLRCVYGACSLFVCQSNTVADYYSYIPKDRKRVIPNPIDPESIPDLPDSRDKRVVAVGRLNKQKNFPLLIKSFAKIRDNFSEYKLEIYGEGPERNNLQCLIHSLGMEDHILLKGAHPNVMQQTVDAALFVMSSDFEGFPNALLEAMGQGLPVISTDFATGVARELISEENGIVTPTGDENAMAEALTKMLSDEAFRIKCSGNNREKIRKYYTENIVRCWETAFDELIG